MTDRAADVHRDLADQVDATWDAVVRGNPLPPDTRVRELTAEARRLHARDRAPAADPIFLARLRKELTMPTPLPTPLPRPSLPPASGNAGTLNGRVATSPSHPVLAPRRRAGRWWSAVERVIAAVLVLGLLGGYVALNRGATGPSDQAEAARLCLVDDNGQRLAPIDPWTLADLPAATPIARTGLVGEGSSSQGRGSNWSLSADGSMLVGVEYREDSFQPMDALPPEFKAGDITVVLRDGVNGAERASFHPPAPVWNLFDLSANGDRLLMQRGQVYVHNDRPDLADPPEWYVFDTTDGRLLTTIVADDGDRPIGARHEAWLTPDGDRVFRLIKTAEAPGSGPEPVRIVVHDASTGAEVGRRDLPNVRAGIWTTDRRINGRPVREYVAPGHAFSPDGRRLALVDEGGAQVTLIDTERLAVEGTFNLPPPTDIGNAAAPSNTASEPQVLDHGDVYEEGRWLWAAFSADGTGLYVGGWHDELDAVGGQTCGSVEMRRVNLKTGAVVGRATSLALSPPLWIAPDGKNVYSLNNETRACSYPLNRRQILRRLDARTLTPLAEREFPGPVQIYLVPRMANGW